MLVIPRSHSIIFVAHNAAPDTAGFLIFNASGRIIYTIPSGTPGTSTSLAFDLAGNLYVAGVGNDGENVTIFKNDASFASLPTGIGIGQLAVDSRGNVYLTDFVSSRLFRIDQTGNVTVFADGSNGLAAPSGLAVDSRDNIFVANNPGSSPAFILKFDPSGTARPFATNISFQPAIISMTFDHDDNLYATLRNDDTILKFDKRGNLSVFADVSDGLSSPLSITVGTCPVKGEGKGRDDHDSKEK